MYYIYKINIYLTFLLDFVGVILIGRIFFVVFVFMKNEKEYRYVWIFECLKFLFNLDVVFKVIFIERESWFWLMICKSVF